MPLLVPRPKPRSTGFCAFPDLSILDFFPATSFRTGLLTGFFFSPLINLFILMEADYFTILWWVLPYIDMNQPRVYMCLITTPNSRTGPSFPQGYPSLHRL